MPTITAINTLPRVQEEVTKFVDRIANITGYEVLVSIRPAKVGGVRIKVLNYLQNLICNEFEVEWKDLKGISRNKNLVNARNAYTKICYDILRMTLNEIGDTIGGRDHTTVRRAMINIQNYRKLKDDETLCFLIKLDAVTDEFCTFLKNHGAEFPQAKS